MPSLTTLLEDTSPFLVYSANWRAGTSADDTSADKYTESSFTVTNVAGATVSIGFYGSSVTVFGARRGNHGKYSASIDALPPSTQNGLANPDQFNQVLYNANVGPGLHSLTVTNLDNSFFDVDYVTIQSSIGEDNETLIVNTFQDSHPAFAYTPSSSWRSPSNMIGSFEGGSGHATTDPSAVADLTFQLTFHWSSGDAVALYGPVGPNSSVFSVQIDGGQQSFFSANKQFFRSKQILFFAGNLGVGQHSLKIQFVDSTTPGELAIDYANVYTTPSLGGSFVGAASATSSHKSRSTPIPLIVALAIAIPAAVLIIILLFYIHRLRRRSKSLGSPAPAPLPNNPDLVQPFSLVDPPNPGPPTPRQRMMSQKGLPALRGYHGASSSGVSAVPSTSVGSTSAQGGAIHTSNNSMSSQILSDGSYPNSRRNAISSVIAPPPEYSQTSDS